MATKKKLPWDKDKDKDSKKKDFDSDKMKCGGAVKKKGKK